MGIIVVVVVVIVVNVVVAVEAIPTPTVAASIIPLYHSSIRSLRLYY
jgi:hypothetical protein